MTTPLHSVLTERWVVRILRGGIILSVLFMVTGLFLMTIQRNSITSPAENPFPSDLLSGNLSASASSGLASSLMVVGLVILIFTPFLRVVATVFAFMFEREWKYVAAGLLVLLMLVVEVVFAFR